MKIINEIFLNADPFSEWVNTSFNPNSEVLYDISEVSRAVFNLSKSYQTVIKKLGFDELLKKNSKTMPTDLLRKLDKLKNKFSGPAVEFFSWFVSDVKKERSSHQSSTYCLFY